MRVFVSRLGCVRRNACPDIRKTLTAAKRARHCGRVAPFPQHEEDGVGRSPTPLAGQEGGAVALAGVDRRPRGQRLPPLQPFGLQLPLAPLLVGGGLRRAPTPSGDGHKADEGDEAPAEQVDRRAAAFVVVVGRRGEQAEGVE